MYERFTDRARKVMQLANQEAQRLNHKYICTEDILLGLVKEGSGVAAMALKNLDVDLRKIRLEVEKLVQSGPHKVRLGKLPQSARLKKIVEYSIEEARNLNHNYVGSEHLLLGLLREQEGVAAQVLMNLGLRLEDVREEVLNILGASPREEDSAAEPVCFSMGRALNPGFVNLPRDIVQSLKVFDDCFEKLTQEKEAAIARQDFDRAARLRDTADKLKRQLLDALEKLHALVREAENDPK
jgi:ATP-dependent Clp protease ATP-binding subunit ClpA